MKSFQRWRLLLSLALLLLPSPAVAAAAVADAGKPRPPSLLARPDQGWVNRTLKRLSLREKIAQLIQVRVMGRFLNRDSGEYRALLREISESRVGGVVLFAGNIYESAVILNDLQAASRLPLMVSADFERGASFRIEDTTSFPWTMAVGATASEDLARRQGMVTAREARALGVHWIYAPVMDVNNNPDNPVINIRSYGEDPQLVARLGAAFIRGARENGVMTTAKHFPGHGDTATDTHIGLAVIPSDRARLDSLELVPFRRAIEAGVDSVMTAHIAVPQLTGDADTPATLSERILKGLLRQALHFDGLVVTDALEMGGITTRTWAGAAAVRALKAGADMLLLTPDTTVALNEVLRAVRRGEITEQQIEQSARKVLEFKSRLGLQRRRTAPLDSIASIVASPESRRLAQEIADRSITLVKDDKKLIPISPIAPPRILSVAISSDLDASPAAVFQAEMRRRFPTARTLSLDPRTSAETADALEKAAAQSEIIVCASLVRVISGKGSISLPDAQRDAVGRIFAAGKPVCWIALGSPYVLRALPPVDSYMCTFSYADVSQLAAAKALSGEIEIAGKMPVSIPGHCRVGEGLQVPSLDMTLRPRMPQEAGLPEGAFRETLELLDALVENKTFPGAALVVGYRGGIVLDAASGRMDYAGGSPKASGDTIYDLASLTKAVAATSAAMMLAESGRLLLGAAVQEYLPEFQGANKEKVLVRHLLSHSSGLPAFVPIYKEAKGYEEVLARACAAPLEFEPGTRAQYSDLGMMLLGEIMSRASGRSLDQIVAGGVFGPLGMKSTGYRPDRALLPRIAPTEEDPWRGRIIRGEVHDENAYAMGGVSGHAGLFSSAHDLALFAQMLLNGGIYDHRRYVSAATIRRFTTLETGSRALGWGKPVPAEWSEKVFSPEAFGHTGFTGTMIWIDPGQQLFIILLSNRVHPTRENQKITEGRQAICESVVRAVRQAGGDAPQLPAAKTVF